MGDISNEPSMEDILSSIKRIIADEGEAGLAARSRPAPRRLRDEPRPRADVDEILELTETFDQRAEPASPVRAEAPVLPEPPAEPELVSENVATASRSALASLSAMVIKPDQPANTLEGMVREMLRPMLKEWLDTNLPDLVESMVAREIARISGK